MAQEFKKSRARGTHYQDTLKHSYRWMFLVNGSFSGEYSGGKCVRTSGKAKVGPRVVTYNHFTDGKTEIYTEVT